VSVSVSVSVCTGYDDPDSDGYSDYGTLGYYTIEASVEEAPEDSGDLEDSGDFGDSEEPKSGACSCATGNTPWPGSLFLLSFFLVWRRKPGM
jgi:MYXO-CTERM domain-containing protein